MPIEFVGAFESCYMPQHDVDIFETSGHTERWADDMMLLRASGVTRLRYPIRWHRIEEQPGVYNWAETDEVLEFLQTEGFSPIFDLLHHMSYPRWLTRGFGDSRLGGAYLRFCEAFALRYPWVTDYTLLNEPFTTIFMCGHQGIWPPHGLGLQSFIDMCRNVLPPLADAMRMFKDLLPAASHLYVEPCEGHTASVPEAEPAAALRNDRRFFILDLLQGVEMDTARPFVAEVIAAGGEDLLGIEGAEIDVLGLDYYAHMEWSFSDEDGICPSPEPQGLTALIMQYWERYGIPMILGETNIRGFPSDRASWLKYTLEACENARTAGASMEGYCWFPFIDSLDWDSLLARADRHIDPVGVYWLDENLTRHDSVMAESYRMAAGGAPASELPAYRFLPPCDEWVAGLLPQMAHWEWQDPVSDGTYEVVA